MQGTVIAYAGFVRFKCSAHMPQCVSCCASNAMQCCDRPTGPDCTTLMRRCATTTYNQGSFLFKHAQSCASGACCVSARALAGSAKITVSNGLLPKHYTCTSFGGFQILMFTVRCGGWRAHRVKADRFQNPSTTRPKVRWKNHVMTS